MKTVLRSLHRGEWGLIAVNAVLIYCAVWLDLRIPEYMTELTVIIQTPGGTVSQVLREGGWMLLCALGSLACSIVVGFTAARVAAAVSRRLRHGVYAKVMDFSLKEIGDFSTPSLINRTTNDITQVQLLVVIAMMVIIRAPMMAILALAKISRTHWEWTALTAATVLVMLVIIGTMMSYALPRFRRTQALTDDVNRVARESLTGLQVVRAYRAEDFQEAKFDVANKRLTRNTLQANMALTVMNPTMFLVMNGLTLGIYWIGALLISDIAITGPADFNDRLTVFSNMVVFMAYAMQVVMAFMLLLMVFMMAPRALVSANRIGEVLNTRATIVDGTRTAGNPDRAGTVEFRNVGFRFPGAAEDVLHDISFIAHPGETVAIIGATGSGKTTVLNLVPRFYDVTSGQVLVNGVDVREYTQEALRETIGYVPQKAVLFAGTITDNVGYGKPNASRADLERAVAIAQARDLVDRDDIGYDGEVAQGGTTFSGGQRQRLSIARAVASDPQIYLFDDSFSALDFRTERGLRDALERETGDVTTLVVAQRIGTIRHADRIVVLDFGRTVGVGTHDELMETCAVYREIAESQLSAEELDR
ncbi:ABC transporter ATP-binding protein [Enemella sp. A6]|uniref:ABC transporter ATP-binding protein n=1 Tax=Enemella sp. A6 TaxID=3440152 RepID=UPI003EB99613